MTNRLDHLFDLCGRTALITGGSSGLGLAIAEALGRQGARIVLVARRVPELQREADRLEKIGIKASFIAVDLAAPGGPDEVVELLSGPVDVLVNAAGINLRQTFETVTLEAFDQHMAIHLRAPFRLIQRLAPTMAERNFGRIIMLASLQSVRAFANSAPYGIAKGGVVQLTRAVAERWSRHGVTCNAIAPGFFPTALTEAVFRDEAGAARNAAQTAVGRNGAPADLFGAVIFFASDASVYVTGQTLFVDGGFTAR
jgi:NAD(P)-dependent dehydrogenase (short-subunit alcohol dehydrogenase family)